ncbi:MAG: hypothetical protein AAFX39_13445 [Pseudomonadota bacterium]
MQAMAQALSPDISQEEAAPQPDVGLAAEMERLAAVLDAKQAEGAFDTVDAAAARKLYAAMTKVYALRTEAGERELPLELGDCGTNATDLMITASALLRAGDLEVFELGMWQSYTRFV